MEEYLKKDVHDEFARRIEAEEARQNKRLDLVEHDVRDLQRLTTAVEKMAVSLETITKEQIKIAQRLDALEDEPADKWRNAVWTVVTALIGAAVALLLKGVV